MDQEIRTMHSQSGNREIFFGNETDEFTEELFEYFLSKRIRKINQEN